ncbi:MAG: hypothetical protein WC634_02785 [archaeon]
MGILGSLFKKQGEEKEKLGVCIPNASKTKMQEKAEAEEEPFPQAAEEEELLPAKGFLVTGIFHVQNVLMVQGTAGCKIKKKDKTKFGGATLVVKDVQVAKQSAGSIQPGQKGALFLRAENGKFPIIKQGDELEF